MIKIIIFSAIQARSKWFEFLNWVNVYDGQVMIKRRNQIVAKIFPGKNR